MYSPHDKIEEAPPLGAFPPSPSDSSADGAIFKEIRSPSNPSLIPVDTIYTTESRPGVALSAPERKRRYLNKRLDNPLTGYSFAELRRMARVYAYEHALADPDDVRALEIGAVLAQNPKAYEEKAGELGLTDEEFKVLEREQVKKWSQPLCLYLVTGLCAVCAAVQGMDETVVNGAQMFYFEQFGIAGRSSRSTWLGGLTNGAPYMCCAFIGCWLTTPLNDWFGRRGTIFITCLISAIACLWQGCVNTWWHMFIARFVLGFGIGPKSTTVPIYAAECAPKPIRGALIMQWQIWTAFGIMLGLVSDLVFYKVKDTPRVTGLNWRLMMGSAMFPAIIVFLFVFKCPESPRWYMSKGRHSAAFKALQRLRHIKIQAARDLFYMAEHLKLETGMAEGQSRLRELFTVKRNKRAMVASEILMFLQQFCGINVIAYYSSSIFRESGFNDQEALGASLGFGVINFAFALPAFWTIDSFGRRNLLLTTLPLMFIFLLFTGFSFFLPEDSKARVSCIALGIYLFGMVYSPGPGPVPFTYSAEAFPLYVRTLGVSLATATTWFFNFLLSVTWLSLLAKFKPQGAFAWYAGWNFVGWWAVLLLMPETKGKELEELDQVFCVPSATHARYGLRQIRWFWRKYILRKKLEPVRLLRPSETSGAGMDNDVGLV